MVTTRCLARIDYNAAAVTASVGVALNVSPRPETHITRPVLPEPPLNVLIKYIDNLTEYCGRAIAWLTLAMALLTCTIVVMRYVLESGSVALQESVSYLHAIIFMLGVSFALKRGAHVRVDIFYRRFSARARAGVEVAGTCLLLMPVCAVMFWLSIEYVANSWSVGETSGESSGLPWVYLLKTLLLVMPVLLILQGLSELLKSCRTFYPSQSAAANQE